MKTFSVRSLPATLLLGAALLLSSNTALAQDDDVVHAPDQSTSNQPSYIYSNQHQLSSALWVGVTPPPFGSHPVTCGPSAPVKVLGVENQFGDAVPSVPTKLFFRKGSTGTWTPMFNGGDVAAGMSQKISIGGIGNPITIKGQVTLGSPVAISEEQESTNPVSVIMLKNGDDLPAALALKGAQAPYGNQKTVAQVLGNFLNQATNKIVLPAGERIFLFEFGSTGIMQNNAYMEAVDYQDLVVHVKYACWNPQDVLLRNSIGPNHQTTNGNKPIGTTQGVSGFLLDIMKFDNPDYAVKLKQFRWIVAQTVTTNPNWNAYDYRLFVWSSLDAAHASSQGGTSPQPSDLAYVPNIPAPTSGPTQFGTSGNIIPFVGIKPTYEMIFDLQNYDLVIPPGTGRYIGILVLNGGGTNGTIGILESSEMDVSDRQLGGNNPGNSAVVDGNPNSLQNGRLAIEVKAVQLLN